jgi:hypothetical protein
VTAQKAKVAGRKAKASSREAKATGQELKAARAPEGLEQVSFFCRFPARDLQFQRLRTRLKDVPYFAVDAAGSRIRGFLESDRAYRKFHGHLHIERIKGEDLYGFQFDIVKGGSNRPKTGSITLSALPNLIQNHLRNAAVEFKGVVTITGELSTKKWEPVINLPFTPSALLEAVPGTPQIAGVDFYYASPSDELPLIRAGVRVFPTTDLISVRVTARLKSDVGSSLVRRMLDSAEKNMFSFVREKPHEPASE